jgi:hypothetical protein
LDGAVEQAVVSMKMKVYELAVHYLSVNGGLNYSHSIVDGGLELMS